MRKELREALDDLWHNHRGKTIGTILGIVFGMAVLCFGFWYTVFVLCCGLVGLFVGMQLDRGEDILGTMGDRVIELMEHFRK